eukprot:6212549-Pleurochrysis_carterae.AAC.1
MQFARLSTPDACRETERSRLHLQHRIADEGGWHDRARHRRPVDEDGELLALRAKGAAQREAGWREI